MAKTIYYLYLTDLFYNIYEQPLRRWTVYEYIYEPK